MMIPRIIDFINILRENEVPIGLTETIDVINCLKIIDLKDKTTFKQALFATLIKSEKHIDIYEVLFEQFFSNFSTIKEDMLEAELKFIQESETLEGKSDDQINELLQQLQDNNQLLIFQETGERANFQDPNRQGFGRTKSKGSGTDDLTTSKISDLTRLQSNELLELSGPFKQLITLLGKKLATKLGLKYKKKKRILDFRKTIRYNLKHGGKFLNLHFKNRNVSKPQLICLIDMSDSCEYYYSFMFYLVFLIKQQYSRVKVFEFDSDIIDISRAMKAKTIEAAKEEIIKTWDRNDRFKTRNYFKTHSDYYSSFSSFVDENLDLNKKTTLLILGDCRDNLGVREPCEKDECIRGCPDKCLLTHSERDCLYCNCKFSATAPKSAKTLKKILKRIKRLIILNPEDESNWNVGDSVAHCYKNIGAEVYPVNDLKSLFHVVYERL